MAQFEPMTTHNREVIERTRVLCARSRALRAGYNALLDEAQLMLARSEDLIVRINGRFG